MLAACDYQIDILQVSDYAERYLRLMHHGHMSLHSPLRILCLSVCNDSCFTYANLCFETYSVAMACALIASQMFSLPLPFVEVVDRQIVAASPAPGRTTAEETAVEGGIKDNLNETTELKAKEVEGTTEAIIQTENTLEHQMPQNEQNDSK